MKYTFKSTLFLWVLFFLSCTSSETDSTRKNSYIDPSKGEIVETVGKIEVATDNFLFFTTSKKRGFFIYPTENVPLIKSHFYVTLYSGDTVTCGLIQNNSESKKVLVQAELLKAYKGDISGVASICSGRDARVFITTHSGSATIDMTPIIEYEKFTTPHLIFPFIPYFGSTLKDIASPRTDNIKIIVKIEVFDRASKETLTNCTYYSVNGEENPTCFGAPIIYPEISFHGRSYKSQHLRSIRSTLEYLDKITG